MSCLGSVQPADAVVASYGPVYLVDGDADRRAGLAKALRAAGLAAHGFGSSAELLAELGAPGTGCIVLGLEPASADAEFLARELAERGWPFPIVAVTPEADVAAAVRAMKAGAVDVLPRPVAPCDLVAAVKGALVAVAPSRANASTAADRERLARLTRRERQVLEGMVRGEANKAIAFHLGISPRTVEVHRAKVMEKLRCRSLPDIVRLALLAGMDGA